jgi:hypothetical protein
MNVSSIFVALPCHSVIFFEFSNINAILGDEVANPIMVAVVKRPEQDLFWSGETLRL